jgi:hypothetical protein
MLRLEDMEADTEKSSSNMLTITTSRSLATMEPIRD